VPRQLLNRLARIADSGVVSCKFGQYLKTVPIARWPVKHCSHQIAQLIGREMVAFQVCG
jgi:hypothetical protein